MGSHGIHLLPIDMAKLGYLYLRKGRWGKKQIISAKWIEKTFANTVRQKYGEYGYLIWKYKFGGFGIAGIYGQNIFIFPEYDSVVVLTAKIKNGHDLFPQMVEKYIIKALNTKGKKLSAHNAKKLNRIVKEMRNK